MRLRSCNPGSDGKVLWPGWRGSWSGRKRARGFLNVEQLESRWLLSGPPVLNLTPAGRAAGFTLSTFATGFPQRIDGFGPAGITFPASGGVLVADAPGNVRLFPSDTDGQNVTQASPAASYGDSSASGLARVGNSLYLMMGGLNQVARVNANGTVAQVIASVPGADGVTVDTLNGHLFVSSFNGPIYDVDPVAGTATPFLQVPSDGLAFDAATGILYAALYSDAGPGYRVQGFNIASKAKVFDSGPIMSGPDGVALGIGAMAGNLFVNTNGGTVVEINLQTNAQTIIASGGSRGDFVTVDPSNGTLLVTQSDRIMRLAAPSNGGSGSNPLATLTQLSSSPGPSRLGQQVTITAIVTAGSADPTAGTVVFTIDGVAQPPVALSNVGGQEEAILQTSTLAAGTHVVTAAYSGMPGFAASSAGPVNQVVIPVNPAVVGPVDGPRVESLQRLGIRMMPTSIVITFNSEMNAAAAEDVRNYRLVDARGRRIGIRRIDYNASAMTVTLHPVRRLNIHQSFVLTINGTGKTGLKDLQGLLLDGQGTGQPGSDYTTTITMKDLVSANPPKHARARAHPPRG